MKRIFPPFLLFLSVLALVPGCGKSPRFNLLIVTLDTTRRDHLGCYGCSSAVTPTLDSLAAGGIRFERCWSVAPVTLPAHASIFTGLYPPAHGVRDNGLYRLEERFVTLAERLAAAGYEPAAVVGSYVLASRYGLAQGFKHYDERFASQPDRPAGFFVERSAGEVSAAAREYLESRPADKPFALWLHYFDPHAPYVPPAPYDSLFAGSPYDGEIAYMDNCLGRVIATLKSTGRYDNTLILALADHGESLGEHGEPTHGIFLYNPTVRVPLILRLPGGEAAGTVVSENVSQVDILPTVLEGLGLESPAETQGRSLLALARGTDRGYDPERTLYLETHLPENSFGWHALAGYLRGESKFIQAPEPELYNLTADPGETDNLALADSSLLGRAESRYSALERDIGAGSPAHGGRLALDAESAQRLRALGYISGGLAEGASHDGERPDPKLMIRSLGGFLDGVVKEAEGDYDAALESFAAVLRESPGNAFAHLYRGFIFWRRGELRPALDEFGAAVDDNPRCDGDYLLGLVYARMDSLGQAKYWLERCLKRNPSHARAAFMLSQVWLGLGAPDNAFDCMRQARKFAPQDKEILNDMGKLLLDRGDSKGAEECFSQALQVDSLYPLARFNLGLAAYRLGDLPRARRCLEQVATQFSGDEKVQNNLGVVLYASGEYGLAERSYRAALALDSLYAPAWNNLGNAVAAQGETREAETYYLHALALDSAYAQAELNLGMLYLEALNRPKPGREHLARALALEPGAPWAEQVRNVLEGRGK